MLRQGIGKGPVEPVDRQRSIVARRRPEKRRNVRRRGRRGLRQVRPGSPVAGADRRPVLADGRPISEVAWPEGSTLVSVRRGRHVMVPAGATVLAAGDTIVAFGTRGAAERVRMRLSPEIAITEDDLGH